LLTRDSENVFLNINHELYQLINKKFEIHGTLNEAQRYELMIPIEKIGEINDFINELQLPIYISIIIKKEDGSLFLKSVRNVTHYVIVNSKILT
jgi:hypothetical protein